MVDLRRTYPDGAWGGRRVSFEVDRRPLLQWKGYAVETHQRVIEVIAHHAGRQPHELGPLMKLDEPPLDLDSMDRVELAMRLEDEFAISLPDDEVDMIEVTVAGLIAVVEKKLDEPLILGARSKHPVLVTIQPAPLQSPQENLARAVSENAERRLYETFEAGYVAASQGNQLFTAWENYKGSLGL